MRIFKIPWFARFAAREGITDSELKAVVSGALETGRTEASLGGGVYKARLARPGGGKSGGYRVIVFFKSGFRTFFAYGFEKSARANIGQGELRAFKKESRIDLELTEAEIEARIAGGTLAEVL